MNYFKVVVAVTVFTLTLPCVAQMPGVVIQIDLDNVVFYYNDVIDYSRLGSTAGPTVASGATFATHLDIGDIVAINGKRAKGIWISRSLDLPFQPTPNPGQAIADAARGGVFDEIWDIYLEDGTHVGGLMLNGTSGGSRPPGGPLVVGGGGSFTVVGGTGAFFGARGQRVGIGILPDFKPIRRASISEDPANRRANGGAGPFRAWIHLLPLMRPEVLGVFHSDFSSVTAERPARPGETVILSVTGLGPTRPGLNPEELFPDAPLQEVNSPVEVSVNGVEGQVINKVGWPRTTGRYRVDVRIPDNASAGMAKLRLTAAWVPGPEVQFVVR